jgi:hypothetical protein
MIYWIDQYKNYKFLHACFERKLHHINIINKHFLHESKPQLPILGLESLVYHVILQIKKSIRMNIKIKN